MCLEASRHSYSQLMLSLIRSSLLQLAYVHVHMQKSFGPADAPAGLPATRLDVKVMLMQGVM